MLLLKFKRNDGTTYGVESSEYFATPVTEVDGYTIKVSSGKVFIVGNSPSDEVDEFEAVYIENMNGKTVDSYRKS